ncbi:hypothetical protein [Corynebacterium sp. HMSC04H06]|uniref:hypothetical protein n=1 Tax=Corynebacterium sp. HMSC04H06 TaxID=1581050 RepID=UPI00114CE187|nr:hypothetical protein [Corynebacterium sp. HMSC04H06]
MLKKTRTYALFLAIICGGSPTAVAEEPSFPETNASASYGVQELNTQDLNCTKGEKNSFVDEKGLTHVSGCYELGTQTATRDNHWSPYEDKTFHCGTSYIRNQQIAYLFYRGQVHASGDWATGQDCGGTGRVYRASMAYSRDGKTLSSAMVTAGQTKTITARDSVGPNAPRTVLNYNFIIGP